MDSKPICLFKLHHKNTANITAKCNYKIIINIRLIVSKANTARALEHF